LLLFLVVYVYIIADWAGMSIPRLKIKLQGNQQVTKPSD